MTEFSTIAELVIDVAREIQIRAAQAAPVVPLTPTQAQVMRYVHANTGCSASDISDGAGLQRANVSTILRELRGRGYLTSHRDDDDGRAIRIYTTPQADENIARLRASWAAYLADAWNLAAPDEAVPEAVADALERIRAGFGVDNARRAGKAFAGGSRADDDLDADSDPTASVRVRARG